MPQIKTKQHGSVLALAIVVILLLTLTGAALIKAAHGQLLQSVQMKNREAAFIRLAGEQKGQGNQRLTVGR